MSEPLWTIHYRDGRVERLDPGDLWELHTEDIVEDMRGFGVVVAN